MVITEVLLRPNGSATSRFRITILTAKRAMDRKAEPQRNASTPFLCENFAISAAFAVNHDHGLAHAVIAHPVYLLYIQGPCNS